MTTAKTQSLHEKLVEVALAIRNIDKGGHNDKQHYSFVQESDVVRTVYPALLEKGIMFYPRLRRVVGIVEYKTQSGSDAFLTTVESVWLATDGTESIEVASLGQGVDFGGDKGVYKALTGDKKYAILQLLGIATGDDPEKASQQDYGNNYGDTVEAPPAPKGDLTDQQKELLKTEATKAGFDLTDMAKAAELGQNIFEWTGKRSVGELTGSDLNTILTRLSEIQTVAGATA